jgi:hypothetical protein
VAISNHSHGVLEVDWSQWELVSSDERNRHPAVDPLAVKSRLENRARWASFFGGLGEALNKKTAYVYGPGGTSTITIQPTPSEVRAAAEVGRAPLMLEARYLHENALLLTTLHPGGRGAGLVMFNRIQGGVGTLRLSLPGLPPLSFPVVTP